MIKKVKYGLIGFSVVLCVAVAGCAIIIFMIRQKVASEDPRVWEGDIRAFEEADRIANPPAGGVLFVGSSSFRMWKTLKRDMSPLPVINRGFGGSKLQALIHYADRIIYKYKPAMIVIYCGDNDMTVGRRRSPEEVMQNVKLLVDGILQKLPNARIYFVSIKPSPSRIEYWPAMARANALIAGFMKTRSRTAFIDVSSAMFDEPSGRLKTGLFVWDRIHMNEKGYAIWTGIIRPVLLRDFALQGE